MKKNFRNSKILKEERLGALRVSRENLLEMQKPRKKVQDSFIAKYDSGECPRCLMLIEQGQRVRYDSEDRLAHVKHDTPEVVYDICDSCFLAKPCECDS